MEYIWNEKYRPKVFEEFISPPLGMGNVLRGKNFPNLLLIGRPGLGKTTLAYIIINHFSCPSLELNASDERGIDTVRNKIKIFAMRQGFKICLLDEVDYMTREAQTSLRRIMEIYKTCRFILTANYLGRVILPIRSRCMVSEFRSPKREDIIKRLEKICDMESVKCSYNILEEIVNVSYPDIRNAINTLQYSVDYGEVKEVKLGLETIYEAAYLLIRRGDWKLLRALLRREPVDFNNLYTYLFDKFFELEIDDKEKILLTIADRMYKGAFCADPEINAISCFIEIGDLLKKEVR